MDYMKRSKFKLSPEVWELLSELLIKIIGETVSDRILRAVLVGVVAVGVQLATPDEARPAVASTQQR